MTGLLTAVLAGVLHPLVALTTHGDPLYDNGVGWFVWVVDVIKVLVAFVVLLVSVMLMIWFERKLISDMQSRIGPNRAGPWGLLQTLADGTKLFFKEDLLPERADRVVFKLAPYLSLVAGAADLHGRPGRRHHHDLGPHVRAAGGRPAGRHPARAGDVVDRGLRRRCSPAGRRGRSTRCSARSGRRRR